MRYTQSIKETDALRIFKILSSKTRLKILSLLFKTKKNVCVKEIAHMIGSSHSATSHQLAKLESLGLVTSFRKGQTICYHPTDARITKHIASIMRDISET